MRLAVWAVFCTIAEIYILVDAVMHGWWGLFVLYLVVPPLGILIAISTALSVAVPSILRWAGIM